MKIRLFQSFQNNIVLNLWWTPLMPPFKVESRPIATFVFCLTTQSSSIRWRSKNAMCRGGVSNLYHEIYRCTAAACMVECGYYTYAVWATLSVSRLPIYNRERQKKKKTSSLRRVRFVSSNEKLFCAYGFNEIDSDSPDLLKYHG